ncbi:MAG: imidazole glycerol phosphate synthase subunit HisF [Deltaproteobacteria bacterium]|nr:MAG: imidazole glycerol phosphate synthase subunit HisF [Deltaproteobacteria bacterium]
MFIPLTAGGGIKTLDDISRLLDAGCDKISINSYAIENPSFIDASATKFGSSTIVVAIDAKRTDAFSAGEVVIHGGRTPTSKGVLAWAKEVADRGAGEILLTSMDADGTKNGFDLELISSVAQNVNINLIASGGAGKMEHFKQAFEAGADAALAASVFHFGQIKIDELKSYLHKNNINVRL